MLYYLAQILIGPTVTRFAETRSGQVTLIFLGTGVSGVALLSLSFWQGFWAVTVSIAALGVGHALMRSPQAALTIAMSGSSARLAYVRLLERLGALAGLAAAAFWFAEFGAERSIEVMATLALVGGAFFAIMLRLRRDHDRAGSS